MQRWNLGDVTITTIPEIDIELEGGKPGSIIPSATARAVAGVPWLAPHYATPDGRLKIAIQAIVIDTGRERILVDPGIGNGRERRSPIYHMLQTPFLEELKAAGYSRDAITCVINTHLHMDHVGWNTMWQEGRWVPTFPKARYLIPRGDFEFYSASDDTDRQTMLSDSVVPVVEAGIVEFFNGDTRVTPEVSLLSTPGHSPAHASVVVAVGELRAVITGDVLHSPSQIAHPEWSSGFDVDQEASRATRIAFLRAYADEPILVIGTHFPAPSAGQVARDGDGYHFVTRCL